MSDWLHGRLQGLLCARLDHAGLAATGLDLQMGGVVHVADIAMYLNAPTGKIPNTPPHVIVEVVSAHDDPTRLLEKLNAYSAWPVPHIWVVEAQTRRFAVFREGELEDVRQFELPERKLRITSENVFAAANAR